MTIKHDPGNFRFCPLCRTALTLRLDGLQDRLACPACDYIYYNNPIPAAGGVIVRHDRVCLVRRSVNPRKGDWTLPAGFMEHGESPSECAEREIAEETGLQVTASGVFGVYAGFDDPRNHVVLILYRMAEKDQRPPIAGDDADDVGFFALEDIPRNIAFRAHRQALGELYGDRYRRAQAK